MINPVTESSNRRFYVYELSDSESGEVFYVGKGQGERVDYHEKEARTNCACRKCQRIRGIWAKGAAVAKRIVLHTNSEKDAYQYERQRIKQYPKDRLCNCKGGHSGKQSSLTTTYVARPAQDEYSLLRLLSPEEKLQAMLAAARAKAARIGANDTDRDTGRGDLTGSDGADLAHQGEQ